MSNQQRIEISYNGQGPNFFAFCEVPVERLPVSHYWVCFFHFDSSPAENVEKVTLVTPYI